MFLDLVWKCKSCCLPLLILRFQSILTRFNQYQPERGLTVHWNGISIHDKASPLPLKLTSSTRASCLESCLEDPGLLPCLQGNLHWVVSDSRAHLAVSQASPFFPLIRLPGTSPHGQWGGGNFCSLGFCSMVGILQFTSPRHQQNISTFPGQRKGREALWVSHSAESPFWQQQFGWCHCHHPPPSKLCLYSLPAYRRLFSSGTEVPALVHPILKLGLHSPSHRITVKAFLWKKKETVPTKNLLKYQVTL